MTASRFPIVLTVASLAAFAILIGLGTWQLQRLHWKEGLIAAVEARRTEAPLPVASALRRPDPEFSRVTLTCPGLGSAPYVELYSMLDGQAGSRLISVCRAPNSPPVLVDRGFVQDIISARPPVSASETPITIMGALRAGEPANLFTPPPRANRFYVRDVAAIGAALGAPDVARYMVAAETSTNPEWAGLRPEPLPAELSNRHLGYVITWYGLAAALAGVYAAALWRRMRAR